MTAKQKHSMNPRIPTGTENEGALKEYPFVSVVTPFMNEGNYLGETIESVKAHNHKCDQMEKSMLLIPGTVKNKTPPGLRVR